MDKFFKMVRSFSRILRRFSKEIGWTSRLMNLSLDSITISAPLRTGEVFQNVEKLFKVLERFFKGLKKVFKRFMMGMKTCQPRSLERRHEKSDHPTILDGVNF